MLATLKHIVRSLHFLTHASFWIWGIFTKELFNSNVFRFVRYLLKFGVTFMSVFIILVRKEHQGSRKIRHKSAIVDLSEPGLNQD